MTPQELPSRLDTPCPPQTICDGRAIVYGAETPGGKYRFASWQLDLTRVPPTTGGSLVDSQLGLPSNEFQARMFDSLDELTAAADREFRRLYPRT